MLEWLLYFVVGSNERPSAQKIFSSCVGNYHAQLNNFCNLSQISATAGLNWLQSCGIFYCECSDSLCASRASGVNPVLNRGVLEPDPKNFDFFRQISEKFLFFQVIALQQIRFFEVNFRKTTISSGNFTKKNSIFPDKFPQISIFQEILNFKAIYSDFLANNYSISLQKSPLSNILPVNDKI